MRAKSTDTNKTKSQLAEELAAARRQIEALTAALAQARGEVPSASLGQELFHDLFLQMHNGVVIYEAVGDGEDFVILDFNPAAEIIEKISRDQVVGRRVSAIFPGIKPLGLFAVFQRVWATGIPEHHAASYYKDQRTLGWRENYVFKLASGELVAVYEDVTAQKQLEKELRQKQTLLDTVVNTIPDIICLKDGEGRWLLANDYDLELFQLQGVDYKGKTDAELAPYSDFYQDAFLACMDTDNEAWARLQPSRGEEIIPRPDGTARVFDVVKIPLFNPDGTRQALVVAGRDITERRRAQEKNEENERRFRLLFHNAPMPYQSLDPQGRLIDVNGKWLQTLGYEREEVIGRPFSDFIVAAPDRHFEIHFRQMKKLGALHNVELHLRKKDGSALLVSFDGEMLTNTKGELVQTLCVFRDITRQKELDQMLQHSRVLLEEQVLERTRELRKKGADQQKILLALEKKSQDLHDANIALNVLLEQGSKAKQELEGKILENIKELVFPYLDELDMELFGKPGGAFVNIIRRRLEEITSSFSRELTSKLVGLTPRELQVAELVKQGRSNKDIARLLHISLGTADVYRNNIRKKLGLKNKKINLRSFLLTHY